MDYSYPPLLALRRIGQQLGVLRPFVRAYRKAFSVKYEEQFDKELLDQIRPGDVVWDVGANIGYFTTKFSAITGSQGTVVAFEPSQGTFQALSTATASLANVKAENCALSDFDGQANFRVSTDKVDPTNSLLAAAGNQPAETVNVYRADSYCARHPDLIPNTMKIDVEGFELEVLDGLSKTLKEALQLRSIFIEVHFAVLAERGYPTAPAKITSLLRENGFVVKWVDPSHIAAIRA